MNPRTYDCTGTISPCERFDCPSCCPHDLEDGQCPDCGTDFREQLSARAYDRAKDARKYGDT